MKKVTIAEKIAAMTSNDKAAMAEETGLSYDEVCARLESMRKASLRTQSPAAKAAAKLYREKVKEQNKLLKDLL